MSVVVNAAALMEQICGDDTHGYSQANRWGTPDYDCSSLIIDIFEKCGVPVKTRGATFTGNMKPVFISCGFKDVTTSVNLTTGEGLVRGDVLLNQASHTAMYLGSGKVGHARSSEGNCMPGDQSGNEIRVQGYWNYPWDCVLRYFDKDEPAVALIEVKEETCLINIRQIKEGDKGYDVYMAQSALNRMGYNCGIADGEFGPNTRNGVNFFKLSYGMKQDGIMDKEAWAILFDKR